MAALVDATPAELEGCESILSGGAQVDAWPEKGPVPTPIEGGGPAGVVELPRNADAGLLGGVVVEEAFAVVGLTALNRLFEVSCGLLRDSAGLLGVP